MAKSKIAERIDGRQSGETNTPVLSISDSLLTQARRPPRTPAAVLRPNDRRRLERDLHDGVQSELVVLILKLAIAKRDPMSPPALAEMLAGLEARAQAALDSVRDIVRGIYPPLLADFGLAEALRAQAKRAAVDVRLIGSAPRSTEAAEQAIYFTCSEAIQNATKYAGAGTQVTLRLHYDPGSLAVRIADDGRGFDPAHTASGAGLDNMRDRIEDLGGTFKLASRPGHGTALTISLPWPATADRRR